jgi:hypothetical protein
LQQLIRDKAPWICDRFSYIQQFIDEPISPKQFVSGESIHYVGRRYRLQRIHESTEVRLCGHFLEIPDLSDRDLIRQQVIDW